MRNIPFYSYKFHHYIIKINVDIDEVSLVAYHTDYPQLLIYEIQNNHSINEQYKNLFI